MTPAEQAYWQTTQRRIATLRPEMAAAVLHAFATLRKLLTDAQLTRLIASGAIETIITHVLADAVLDRAFLPVRTRIRLTTQRAFQFSPPSLPSGKVIAVQFDTLAPNVVPALRALEARVLAALKADVRAVVRQAVEEGLIAKRSSAAIAKGLRDVIGLGPTQAEEVQNFRAALMGERNPFTYQSRNRQFDALLKRLRKDGKSPTPAQVERMVDAYRKKRIAINADTVARTATTDAFKAGQRLSWQQAVEQGAVDGSRLKHQWIGVADDRERPSHVVMNNQVQPWNVEYSNGQMVPGVGEYNCRCIDRFFLTAA